MNNLSGRLVIYLVGGAAIFVILFGIRGSAYIINPILLAAVITITVLPIPGRLTKRGVARLVVSGADHCNGCAGIGAGYRHSILLDHQINHGDPGVHRQAPHNKPPKNLQRIRD